MRKTKQQTLDIIKDAIRSLKEDILRTSDASENLTRAEAIKRLADAYKSVSKG